MSTYGRNFDVRVPPLSGQRGSRYSVDEVTVIGVPVLATGDEDAYGRQIVELATGDQAKPKVGIGGVMIYEVGPETYDTFNHLTLYSDISTADAGRPVQVVNGNTVKIVLKNTPASTTFLHTRTYVGRKMVAGVGATPTLVVGDYLTPGTGNDTDGYWAKTSTAANGWLVVTSIDSVRDEVEARLNF